LLSTAVTAAAPSQFQDFSRLLQASHPPNPTPDDLLAVQNQISQYLTQKYFAVGLKNLLFLAILFAPIAILILAAWDHLGGALTVLSRDYLAVLAGLLFAWTAAHLPIALLWFLANPTLAVPLQALGLIAFLIFAAPVLSTVTGGTTSHAAIAAAIALITTALARPFLTGSGNLLYMFASPWLLFFLWQRFNADIGSLGTGLANRQNFKRQLELATINPHDADAHYQLGLIYVQRRLPAEAEQRFRRALEIDKNEPEVLFQLGRLLRHQDGRHEEARPHHERAAELDPKIASHEVWRELGAVALLSAKNDDALRYLAHYTAARNYDPEGLVLYGRALRAAGKHDEATAAFLQAIESVKGAPSFRRPELARWEAISRQELKAGHKP
jgi:Flp pilus assembly protein TadD